MELVTLARTHLTELAIHVITAEVSISIQLWHLFLGLLLPHACVLTELITTLQQQLAKVNLNQLSFIACNPACSIC